ncbi:MAG: alpha/beta-type small acid-soluble spore protein [Clostridia bacterium]|nr:alpha/beta-type small acid-soluble spore protein [Clostridia bacterium]
MSKEVKSNAKAGLDKMKFEVAREIGVDLKQGYNGDLTSAQAGHIGGQMTKKLVEKAEQNL